MKTKSMMVLRSRCTISAATCAALVLASCGGSDDDTVTPVAEAAPVTVPFTNGVATTVQRRCLLEQDRNRHDQRRACGHGHR